MGKKSFLLYNDQKDILDKLTNEQAGKIFKAIYNYAETGNELKLSDPLLDMAITPFITTLKRDNKKYEEVCIRNQQNGVKGGRPKKINDFQSNIFEEPKKPTGLLINPENPAEPDNDNDNDIDNDIDNKLNYTTLLNLYKYINGISKNFGSLKECERKSIVQLLKNIEEYVEPSTCITNISFDTRIRILISYWVIKEIQCSPYKIYLNNLTRNMFMQKYLQTQKYIGQNITNESIKANDETLIRFISYFIKCLREEFEKKDK